METKRSRAERSDGRLINMCWLVVLAQFGPWELPLFLNAFIQSILTQGNHWEKQLPLTTSKPSSWINQQCKMAHANAISNHYINTSPRQYCLQKMEWFPLHPIKIDTNWTDLLPPAFGICAAIQNQYYGFTCQSDQISNQRYSFQKAFPACRWSYILSCEDTYLLKRQLIWF